jgi:hypothetical protein
VFELIRSGKVVPDVYAELPLSEARKAHEMLDSNVIMGKLIIVALKHYISIIYTKPFQFFRNIAR